MDAGGARRLVIATTNPHKAREMGEILAQALPELSLLTLADFPAAAEVEETGETFEENARIKALAAAAHTGLMAIADDGGLSIDALGGLPGVKSHRFLGASVPFDVKMREILERMRDVPDAGRGCRFTCAVAIAARGAIVGECLGVREGLVAREMRGSHGFGYDPIFLLPELGRCMAELAPAEKHRVSHRGRALACAARRLRELPG